MLLVLAPFMREEPFRREELLTTLPLGLCRLLLSFCSTKEPACFYWGDLYLLISAEEGLLRLLPTGCLTTPFLLLTAA